MATAIRAFSVVTCLCTGSYCLIMFSKFKSARRVLWFALYSFILGFYSNLRLSLAPASIVNSSASDININLYLTLFSMVTLSINVYTAFVLRERTGKFLIFFCYFILVITGLCMLVPRSYSVAVVYALYALAVFTSGNSAVCSYRIYKDGQQYFFYSALAHFVFMLCTILDLVALILNIDVISARLICIPIYILLYEAMLTRELGASMAQTEKLSQSLQETIERITHSENALMCTQMKADFLYKSLNLITQKCDEDPYTAEDLTVSLSKYLRHTLNFQQLKGIVPLSNEIELIKAFIAIEKQRCPQVKFELNFPDPLPEFHIPPLSIQPLIENAIEHGVSATKPNPKIKVTIMPYRGYYQIDVSDNGDGMDEDMVSSLTDTLNDTARIGIYNIHTRLINLFGKGLVVQSAPGVGTSVSFVVPPDAITITEKEANDAKTAQ